jgi:hypothetical protein
MQNKEESLDARLKEIYVRVRSLPIARMVWSSEFLTDDERDQIPCDPESLIEIVPRVAELRRLSPERVLLDAAMKAHIIDFADWMDLRKLVGEPVDAELGEVDKKPRWYSKSGELRLGSKLVATFRVRAEPTKRQWILDAFQLSDWKSSITNPLWDGGRITAPTGQELSNVLKQMNKRMTGMTLHQHKGGRRISWQAD